ncbi:hypothetical protein DFA_06005 [Cavenderia fasciculata]|uniref:Uncharacterized protein n=1 Tax=Cavenderia fasciculata TaxID=261658 RepID=F4PJU3_CACFS|nr:uncharacterized protein DFA_03724 [Cavenderia fasciculata]XP_004361718.1 uncharacterized protein DFA_06005 [Cavenderia fasciculata]EGG18237.1 hypothetical protein DFA_03724 [Cavenderia fasciculata]EGG23867.1 hypothetical protein DFA_06005 [Cavenderia fasciculata]|eukprot:XP_004357060.1 hypothetical protein DFA_03724 [Cavenderia fasciculata]
MDVDHVSYYEERIEEDEGVEEDVKNEVEVIDYRCSMAFYRDGPVCPPLPSRYLLQSGYPISY